MRLLKYILVLVLWPAAVLAQTQPPAVSDKDFQASQDQLNKQILAMRSDVAQLVRDKAARIREQLQNLTLANAKETAQLKALLAEKDRVAAGVIVTQQGQHTRERQQLTAQNEDLKQQVSAQATAIKVGQTDLQQTQMNFKQLQVYVAALQLQLRTRAAELQTAQLETAACRKNIKRRALGRILTFRF